jgi:ATP-binding cassette subfamily C (CFTR/MRP) protein 4
MDNATATTEDNGETVSLKPSSSTHPRKDEDGTREELDANKSDNEETEGQTRAERPANMLANASWWSRLVFYWPYPLLKLGLERPLVETDVPDILRIDSSRYNREYISDLWDREQERCLQLKNHRNNSSSSNNNTDGKSELVPDDLQSQRHERPSLHRAILMDFFRSIWYIQPVMCITAVAKIVQAIFLGSLIESFDDGAENGYTYASVIVFCGVIILFEHRKWSQFVAKPALPVCVCMCVCAIEKNEHSIRNRCSCRLSGASRKSIKKETDPLMLFFHRISNLFAQLCVCSIVLDHVFFITWRKGMQLRVSCVAAIYDKTLKLSSTHQETNASSGTIMNLASNDVERFLLAALFISHLIWSPLQSIAILVVGWVKMGPAFAVGFCLLIFGFVPFQFYLSNKFAFLRSKIAGITDQRVQFVSQAVQGARVMKMSGYEDRFLDRIAEERKTEVAQIRKANKLKALNEAMFFACNIVISLVVFLVHVGIGGTLTPGNVYTVFTLVNILQLELTKHVSLGVMGVSEVYVSISRIQRFLEFPEKPSSEGQPEGTGDGQSGDGIAISMKNADCYWNFVQAQPGVTTYIKPSQARSVSSATSKDYGERAATDDAASAGNSSEAGLTPALSNISLELRKGQLTCVIGTVGSGKSALLQAIVGELPVFQGSISRQCNKNDSKRGKTKDEIQAKESISYASQDTWIMDGTVRENVTMGLAFDQDWYDRVIDACGLRMDFKIFRDGDQTIVGDRGVQCSGGQRARIGLARSIYRDADVLVVDDPLSAVDARVGKQIFHEALLGLGVRRGKCVVLATHQHQYVHDHRCVLLVAGCLQCVGSYSECVDAAGGKLSLHEAADEAPSDDQEPIEEGGARSKPVTTQSTGAKSPEDDIGNQDKSDEIQEPKKKNDESEGKDESKEGIDSGVVKWETYRSYIHAMGGWGSASFILFTFCLTQGIALWTIITMGEWAGLPPQEQGSWNILGLIIGQGVLSIVLATFRALLSFDSTIKASNKLHDEMAKAVLRAKIAFFDTNP